MLNLFLEHPKSVNLTYLEHAKLSFTLSFKFYMASIKAIVHAIFPFLFIKSSTQMVYDIENQIKTRNNKKDNISSLLISKKD